MLAPQIGNGTVCAKSFSSAVNDWELRVLPMNVEMHGVEPPERAVTSAPNSVNEFRGRVVISEPCRS